MKKYFAGIVGLIITAFLVAFCSNSTVFASAESFVDLPPRPIEDNQPEKPLEPTETDEENENNKPTTGTGEIETPEAPKGTVQTFARESNIKQWDIKTTLLLLLSGGIMLFLILFMLARQKKL